MVSQFEHGARGARRGASPFAAGALASAPTQLMVAPFGVICGAASATGGFSWLEAALLSVVVFAGASQLVIIELLTDGAPWLVVVATGLAVNLRFLMYAAALSPWMRGGGPAALAAVGYLNTDNSFGLAMARFAAETRWTVRERIAFFLGSGVLTWLVWQGGTIAGYWLASTAASASPSAYGLDFLTPLAFLAIVLPLLADRPSWVAAAVAASVSVALSGAPLNLNLIAGGASGIAAGVLAEAWLRTSAVGEADDGR